MPEISTKREVPQLPSQKERAELRKKQFVAIADALLEEGGVEAVSMGRVAEIADCTRTLVYRYFPTREDLLGAVVHLFYERLDAVIPEADQPRLFADRGAGETTEDPNRDMFALFWDTTMEGGLGGAILRTTPLASQELNSLMENMVASYERRFTAQLEERGLTEQQANTIMDSLIGGFTNLLLRARRGEITREEGIDLYRWLTRRLLLGVGESR